MKTDEALTRFLKKCEELGKSLSTRRTYHGYLRHFADAAPELPLYTEPIEAYLKYRKETPAHRGYHFKCLQAFYSYLEQYEGIKSPIPPRGPMGRPSKRKLPGGDDNRFLHPITTTEGGKVVRGGLSVSTSMSISTAEMVEKYITWKTDEGVSKRTIEGYHGKLGAFTKAFPALPLLPDEIAHFLGQLNVDPLTRWDYRKHIIALYHFLEKRQIIPIVSILFPRVKVPRKVRRVLSSEEMQSLFAAAKDFQERVILTLLIDSKIRATELCTLTRENIFPDYIVVAGKTGQRPVPINRETYDMLTNLASDGLLFKVEGRPMKREYLRHQVQDIMHRAGLDGKKLGPHILRHSAAVQHIMHGGDLLSLKEELGHATTRMTEGYAQLAFPQVKQKHTEVNVLGHITPKDQEIPETGGSQDRIE